VHIDLLIERIAGHFLANPTRKGQLLPFLLQLDFGNNEPLENVAINVDMLRCPGILDEETRFLQGVVLTKG
jgi:hypothetical protein